MPVTDRLYSERTGTLAGTNDRVVFYHGLIQNQAAVAPDFAVLEFTQTQESGSTAQSVYSITLTSGAAAPANNNTITIGNAGRTEIYTFTTAASTSPRVIQRVPTSAPTVAACVNAFVTVFNAYTQFNLVADNNGNNIRLRGSVAPGVSTLDFGPRDCSSNATTWGGGAAWGAPAGGGGTVSGAPHWSIVHSGTDKVIFRIRGMRTDDSLAYRVCAWRLHSAIRPQTAVKTSGADGAVDIGVSLYRFTSAGANFLTANVNPGDYLTIFDPTVADMDNNGVYVVASVTNATTLLVSTAKPFVATIAAMDYAIGPGALATETETGIQQVPFDLPSSDQHTRSTPAADAEMPAGAIEVGELAVKVEYDIGQYGKGWVRWAADNNVADTITIAGTEVWTAVAGAPAAFQYQQGGGAAATMANFVAAVNAEATSVARAVAAGVGNVAFLFAKTTAAGNLALAESTASARTIVSAAAMTGSAAAANKLVASGSYTVTAADVTTLAVPAEIVIAAVPSTSTPTLRTLDIQTAAGAFRSAAGLTLVFRQSGANQWVAAFGDALVVVANTDLIRFSCITN